MLLQPSETPNRLGAESGQPVLVYANISKSYGEFQALTDVSLEVRRGEVFGLLGPNGAGKTTLIRVGLDILRPDGGTVTLFGAALTRHALDRVSYLPEERGLYKSTRVLDALVYLGMLKGMKKAEARQKGQTWLTRVGLGGELSSLVGSLSKGMNQKVQIVAALFSEPALCILDEPFSGLDPAATAVVKELILERRANGQATILSTHRMNQVEALCDRVAIIHGGKNVVYGPVDDVRRDYSEQEVLLDCPELVHVQGAHEKEGTKGSRRRIVLDTGLTPAGYLKTLVLAGVEIQHFEVRVATMEEIFLRVTGAQSSLLDDEGAAPE